MSRTVFLFYCLLLVVFVIEGFGLPFGRLLAPYILFFGACVLLLLDVVTKKTILLPGIAMTLFGGFILLSLASALSSIDVTAALQGVLLYSAYMLLFLFAYNHHEHIAKYMFRWLVVCGLLLVLYSIAGRNYVFDQWPLLWPNSGYQLVTAYFGLHNNMGDFLVPVLVAAVFYIAIWNKMRYFFIFICLFPFFLFSYSRSAYNAFLLTTLVLGVWGLYTKK